MHIAYLLGGFAALILLSFQLSARQGKVFHPEVVASLFGLPLLTCQKRRWNELVTVREERPYVGTREAYLEGRLCAYFLFGLFAVKMNRYRREIPINTLTRVMFLGESLKADGVDAAFPANLAYGKDQGKGGRMFGGAGL
jgi:hypothetical protein